MRPIRSLLFAPANQHHLLKKTPRFAADAVGIDLEDGTPESQKAWARDHLPEIVDYLREQQLKAVILVRTNGPQSHHVKADLSAAIAARVDGIVLPKLETAADLAALHTSLPIVGMIETARGIANVEILAESHNGALSALAFGAEDYITELGGRRTSEGIEVLYARSRVVLAAQLAGVQALDQVFTSIRDSDRFRRDAELGRQLGYSGKMCVTPGQVEAANAVFSPSPEDVDRSRRLIQAYETAQAEGRGILEFEGNMVDEPVLKRARAVLQLAQPPS